MNSSESTSTDLLVYLDITKKYWAKLKRYVPIILVISVIVGLYQYYRTVKKDPVFSAYSTLMTTESTSGANVSDYSNLASQFGISNINVSVNGEKLKELLQYKKIIEYPLFTRANVNGETDLLINHYIKLNDYHDKWKDSNLFNSFLFEHDSIELFTDIEQDVLKRMHQKIIANNLSSTISLNGIIRISLSQIQVILRKNFYLL